MCTENLATIQTLNLNNFLRKHSQLIYATFAISLTMYYSQLTFGNPIQFLIATAKNYTDIEISSMYVNGSPCAHKPSFLTRNHILLLSTVVFAHIIRHFDMQLTISTRTRLKCFHIATYVVIRSCALYVHNMLVGRHNIM